MHIVYGIVELFSSSQQETKKPYSSRDLYWFGRKYVETLELKMAFFVIMVFLLLTEDFEVKSCHRFMKTAALVKVRRVKSNRPSDHLQNNVLCCVSS